MKRNIAYDYLRILCAVAVIFIHCSAFYLDAATDSTYFGVVYRENLLFSSMINALSRFAVPCFVMLSGALLLSSEKNADYQAFYRKSWRKIGIPTLFFSILYVLYSESVILLKVVSEKESISKVLKPFMNFAKGIPYGHLWYMFMLMGLYLLVPWIIRLKSIVGRRQFVVGSYIYLGIASISYTTSTHTLGWDLGQVFEYAGYLAVGYSIASSIEKPNNKKGTLLILLGVGMAIAIGICRYRQALLGIADSELDFQLVYPLCPLVVIESLCIFAGILNINFHSDVTSFSQTTFYIYLIHAGVLNVLEKILVKTVNVDFDSRMAILMLAAIVMVLSTRLAQICIKIEKNIRRNCKFISKRVDKTA